MCPQVRKSESVQSNGHAKTAKVGPGLTLLDIFSGVKLLLPSGVDDFAKLRRYFVAYDGDLVADYYAASATHTLADNREDEDEGGGRAQRVTSDWIGKCIRKRRVVAPC
ncbi:DNA ligase 3-like [Vanacampus margaritifer]